MLPAERARRGDEIAEHATRNHITHYLILDDVEVGPVHTGRHVRPVAEHGLREADDLLARTLLAGMEDARRMMGQTGSFHVPADLRSSRY